MSEEKANSNPNKMYILGGVVLAVVVVGAYVVMSGSATPSSAPTPSGASSSAPASAGSAPPSGAKCVSLAGQYCASPSDAKAQDCPVGYYTDAAGLTNCKPCDAGTYTDVVRSSLCKTCPAGNYCPARSGILKVCPPNSYCPPGASGATPCAAGATSPVSSKAASDCVNPKSGEWTTYPNTILSYQGRQYGSLANDMRPGKGNIQKFTLDQMAAKVNSARAESALQSMSYNSWEEGRLDKFYEDTDKWNGKIHLLKAPGWTSVVRNGSAITSTVYTEDTFPKGGA